MYLSSRLRLQVFIGNNKGSKQANDFKTKLYIDLKKKLLKWQNIGIIETIVNNKKYSKNMF